MKKLMFAALCLTATGLVFAQDMSAPTAVEKAGGGDAGAAVVAQAEQLAPELNATQPRSAAFVPAMKVVKDRVEKAGIRQGNGVYIGYGTARWTFDDPGRDKDFIMIRSKKATEAYLAAKAQIIEAIKNSIDAMDRTVGIEEADDDPVKQAFLARKAELDAKKRDLADKLAELDEAESEAMFSTSISAKFGNVLDALSKKLNKDFDAKKIPAEKKAVRDQLRKECAALKNEFDALNREAQKVAPKPTRETESAAKSLSEMPLLGTVVVAQAESWDKTEKEYQMSMAVVWSPRLQETAIAMSEGNLKTGKPGKYTKEEWKARQNLEVMVGPRSFTDKDGHKIFVGIGVADMECPAEQKTVRMRDAALAARASIAFSIGCDMKAYTESKTKLTEYSKGFGTKSGTSKSIHDVLASACHQELSGCIVLDEKEFRHPISKRKMYVVAYYIDPVLNAKAMEYLKSAYAGAIRQDRANKYKAGVHQGAKDALKDARASQTEFNRGRADGKAEVKDRATRINPPQSVGAQGSNSKGGGAAQGGTFMNNDIDTDF